MLDWIKKAFEDSTGVPDEARVCAVSMVLGYLLLAAYSVIFQSHPFDMQAFGIGAGALSAGVGGWFNLRGSA